MTVNNLVPFEFKDISPNMVFMPTRDVSRRVPFYSPCYLRPICIDRMGLTFSMFDTRDLECVAFIVTYDDLRSDYLASIDAKSWHKCEKVSNSSS